VNVGRCLSHRATESLLATSAKGGVLSSDMGHRPIDLARFDNFAERLAVGVFANEAWVENVPSIAWEGSDAAKWTDGSASFVFDVHSSTVGLQIGVRSTRNRRTGLCRCKLIRWVPVGRNIGFCAVTTTAWEAYEYTSLPGQRRRSGPNTQS
jgi:hypothetical protein